MKNQQNIQKNLSHVLKTNEDDICNVWLRRLLENWSESSLLLKRIHLQSILLPGFRDFISSNQNSTYLTNALMSLTNEFRDFLLKNDEQNVKSLFKQIQTAIYYFQDAIDSILKIQNIPPHWIFALDSLIRQTVHTAVNHLLQHFKIDFNLDDVDTITPESNLTAVIFNRQSSCMTNMDGSISHTSFDEEHLFSKQIKEHFRNEVKTLIQENQKTVKVLSDTIFEYLSEQNQFFKNLCDQIVGAKQGFVNNEKTFDEQSHLVNHKTKNPDQRMIEFLQKQSINQSTIDEVK